MAILFRGLKQSKQILRWSNLSKDIPKGYLAVHVGENQKKFVVPVYRNQKRFVVPVYVLNHPSFQELLTKVEEESGFNHPMGGLTVPCREDIFISITSGLSA